MAAPPLALIVAAHRYYLPFPWAEGWVFLPPALENLYAGRLAVSDFCIVLNGYVHITGILVKLPLAWLTNWSQGWEVAANLVCAGLLFLACPWAVWLCNRGRLRRHLPWLVLASIMVFSLNQSCNWFWGFQFSTIAAVTLAGWAVLLLVRRPLGWPAAAGAVVLGALAAFGSGAGLLVWPAGLVALAFRATDNQRAGRRGITIVWVLSGLIACGTWMWLIRHATPTLGQAGFASRFVQALRFLPIYLGAPVMGFAEQYAWVVGWIVLGVGVFLAAILWVRHREAFHAYGPMFSLMVFSVLMGLAAGYGRGSGQESLTERSYGSLFEGAFLRYPLMSEWYWLGLAFMVWDLTREAPARLRRATGRIVLGAVAVAAVLSSRAGYFEAEARYRLYAPLVKELVAEDLDLLPTRLQWPYGNEGREAIRIMKEHELSIYRSGMRAFWERTASRSNWE